MRLLRAHAPGLVSGALAAALGLAVVFLASALRLLPFSPFALALAVVDATPGEVSSSLIDLLQFWAKRLLEVGVVAFGVGFGAVGGALAAAGAPRSRVLAVAAVPWLLGVLAAALTPASRQFDTTGTAVSGAVGLATYAAALAALGRRVSGTQSTPAGRRRALAGIGALVVVLGSGGLFLASLGRRATAAAKALTLVRRPIVAAGPVTDDAALASTAGLTPQITSNRDFYVVDTALFKPSIDEREWRLRVDGFVERPFEITYDELLAMDAVEQVQTLICISNPVGGELMSTAKWTGVRVADLLARAGVRSEAFDLVMTSWDGYDDSILMTKALEPTTLVAYGMNDEVLPVEHGFPARVLVPDIYGMKNVKWIRHLRVESYDFRGYWMDRGWSDVAIVLTSSRIDVPGRTVRWSGGPIRIAGIAFAGARGVQKVEISADQGRTWSDATLGHQVNAFTWRRWYFDWTPAEPGEARLMVRAVDGKGVPQISVKRDPFPAGASGYHLVPVRVERA